MNNENLSHNCSILFWDIFAILRRCHQMLRNYFQFWKGTPLWNANVRRALCAVRPIHTHQRSKIMTLLKALHISHLEKWLARTHVVAKSGQYCRDDHQLLLTFALEYGLPLFTISSKCFSRVAANYLIFKFLSPALLLFVLYCVFKFYTSTFTKKSSTRFQITFWPFRACHKSVQNEFYYLSHWVWIDIRATEYSP